MSRGKLQITGYRASAFVASIMISYTVSAAALSQGRATDNLGGHRSIIQKVDVIGEENRKTVSEYAALKQKPKSEIQKMVSGTGVLSCDEFGGTGNLVGNQSVVVTTAHGFFDESGSRKPVKLCSLFMFEDGKITELQANLSTLRIGRNNKNFINDWAVLTLHKPAPMRFRHYRIPKEPLPASGPVALTLVAGLSDNFTAEGEITKSIGDCSYRETNPAKSPNETRQLVADCDTGHGSSGGAVFLQSELGITIRAVNLGGSGYKYGPFSLLTVIEGDFLQAIEDAVMNSSR